MKKSHFRALERIFANDIDQAVGTGRIHLPYQSKSKVYKELEADGMVRSETVHVGSGWSAVTITGWQLTDFGHLSFCMECEDDDED